MQCERETAYFEPVPSAHAQTLYYSLCFTLFLSRGKNSVALINVTNFYYQHFCFEIFSKIFFSKFFPTIIFSEFFFQIFFFHAFTLDASPHAEIKRLFKYLWYEKYGMQQAVEIGLSSRVMCRVLVFGSYCSHHTRRKKSIFPLAV